MISRTTRLRWRRKVRQRKRQVEDLGIQAEETLEQHFFKRLSRLTEVRRFVFGWILLFALLIGGVIYQFTTMSQYYQTLRPVPGGIFTEGVVGAFTDANPLYATGPVDGAVSRLIFAGLLKYDQSNKLVGDLAQSWTLDDKSTTYTVTLRPNLVWQDGQPLTAQDVVFTYETIQNPDAKSPLFASWQGIKVVATDDRTITFTLPNVLASFPYSLTNGLIPKHLLASTPVSQLRASRFNTVFPVGAGPFSWDQIEISGDTPETREGTIALVPNSHYHDGVPRLQRFVIRSFLDESRMIQSFDRHELTAMSGLEALPDTFAKDTSVHEHSVPIAGEVMVFFKTSQAPLDDAKVRQALVQSVNQAALIKGLGYPVVAAKEPLLSIHIGFDKTAAELPFDITAANKSLDDDGWVKDKDGVRVKNGKILQFGLSSQSGSEYAYVTQRLQAAWAAIGVKVSVQLQSDEDLQATVATHSYDALLYGISIGPDPDVFAYWHSSQADLRAANRVNFSEYKSAVADKALEAGRTRTDPMLRAVKYKPFLDAWRADAPALALYEPRYLYVTRGILAGFDPLTINTVDDRYNNVQNWMIRQARVSN